MRSRKRIELEYKIRSVKMDQKRKDEITLEVLLDIRELLSRWVKANLGA